MEKAKAAMTEAAIATLRGDVDAVQKADAALNALNKERKKALEYSAPMLALSGDPRGSKEALE